MQSLTATCIPERAAARSATLPWFCYVVVTGATSIVIGILWDISWHRTVGRDTFWTPAHLAIYLGGLLGGLTGSWLVLKTTWAGTPEEKAGAVRCWGFSGPLGAWVCIWGSLAMLTSAPFDNWWHDAYGLDVKIISPPHVVLALGMWSVVLGALLMVLREQNLAAPDQAAPGRVLFVYATGILLAMAAVFLIEHSWPNQQRTGTFYMISAAVYPIYLVGVARASKFRWAATLIALVYMGINAAMVWGLPLFAGHPKLGPIYNPVDHFVPLAFPLLLVVPAIFIDLLRGWIGHGRGWPRDWLLVVFAATTFLLVFLATQWFFSALLIGPAGQNWFLAADRHWAYTENLGGSRYKFWSETNPLWNPPLTWKTFGSALLLALASTRCGLWIGNWMARVRR